MYIIIFHRIISYFNIIQYHSISMIFYIISYNGQSSEKSLPRVRSTRAKLLSKALQRSVAVGLSRGKKQKGKTWSFNPVWWPGTHCIPPFFQSCDSGHQDFFAPLIFLLFFRLKNGSFDDCNIHLLMKSSPTDTLTGVSAKTSQLAHLLGSSISWTLPHRQFWDITHHPQRRINRAYKNPVLPGLFLRKRMWKKDSFSDTQAIFAWHILNDFDWFWPCGLLILIGTSHNLRLWHTWHPRRRKIPKPPHLWRFVIVKCAVLRYANQEQWKSQPRFELMFM